MQSQLQKKITQLGPELHSALRLENVLVICVHMAADGALNKNEKDIIMRCKINFGAVNHLIQFATARGDEAIRSLANALREIEMSHLADKICKKQKTCKVSLNTVELGSPSHSASKQKQNTHRRRRTCLPSCFPWRPRDRLQSSQEECSGNVSSTCRGACKPKTIRRTSGCSTVEPRFGSNCARFSAPPLCSDVAVTSSGTILLAAKDRGLIEYRSTGQQLSSWQPTKHITGCHDRVLTVAALDDGRVAVGIGHSRSVILLKQTKAGNEWLEDRHLKVLLTPPWYMSACKERLVVVESKGGLRGERLAGCTLVLMCLKSGHVLKRQKREYSVESAEITSDAIVTVSSGPVNDRFKSNRRVPVIDAYCHTGRCHFWRYNVGNMDIAWDVCRSPDSSVLYIAIRVEEPRVGRVEGISLDDGSVLTRNVMMDSLHNLGHWRLSTAKVKGRAALAILSYSSSSTCTTSIYETV